MGFVLNTNSRTVHEEGSTDRRCRLSLIREENRFEFETLEEALDYLPRAVCCRYCILTEDE